MDRQEAILRNIGSFTGRVWGNIRFTPRLQKKEKIVVCINIIITFIFIYANHWPRITLVLLLNYFVIKALFQLGKEALIDSRYKNISKLFNNQVKIIKINGNEIHLNSFIPMVEIEKKQAHLEHFFSKRIISIKQDKKSFKHIILTLKNEQQIKLKSKYNLSEYIKNADTKKSKIPFLLGVDRNGEIVIGDLFKLKNISISGVPGSGKSVLVNSIIQSLMYLNSDIAFFLIDFKIVELCMYENFNNVVFIETIDHLSSTLEKIYTEMTNRYKKIRGKYTSVEQYNQHEKNKIPTIVIIIDEISEIKLNSGVDKKVYERLENLITLILNKGRAAKIYTIVATQRASSEQLSTEIRANLFSKISFKITDRATQTMAGVTGTESLKEGEFKMITETSSEGNIYKGFFVDTKEEHKTYDELMTIKQCGGVTLEKISN